MTQQLIEYYRNVAPFYLPGWGGPQYSSWMDGKLIGVSTVPGYSYYFRKIISLSYIDVRHTAPGTEVEIVWGDPGKRQKVIRATVGPAPYKKHAGKGDLSRA